MPHSPGRSVVDDRQFEFLQKWGRSIISSFNNTWNAVSNGSLLLA